MSSSKIILTEQCGTLGRVMLYSKDEEHNRVIRLSSSTTIAKSIIDRVLDLFREIFLPHGYPNSVSEDYFDYQIWDTVQAFCSTITGTFTTQAILKSVGVGDAEATPIAAAITWVMKDGTGMIGRILFAWWKGNSLDADCKKWRLCADILNDAAMFLELLVPYCSSFSLQVLCVTTSMKAVVGVAGGATRASITQHQAIQGNMADVSAKDGSQETCVNLIASFVGIVFLALLTEGHQQWALFGLFTFIHLMANYFAVCSLNFTQLNIARLILVLRTYLQYDTVPNPSIVNQKESVIIGFGQCIKDLCGFQIKIAEPLKDLSYQQTPLELISLADLYKNSKYFLVPDVKKRIIYVALENGETPTDVITAYFHALLLGIAICQYNDIPLNMQTKRQLRHVTPLARIQNVLKSYPRNSSNKEEALDVKLQISFNDFVQQEVIMFFTALKINGWNIDTHSIEIGEWRADWKNKTDYAQHNRIKSE